MNNHRFNIRLSSALGLLSSWIFVVLLVVLPQVGSAVESEVLPDLDVLESVSHPGRVQTIGDVEVVDFFWYGCSHCNAVHRQINGWMKTLPAQVHYLRLPVRLTGHNDLHQRLYFTLEALSRLDLHPVVFDDIHFGREKLNTEAKISAWATTKGISADAWKKAFNSTEVRQKAAFAQAAFERFGLNGVPALVINGRYVLPAGSLKYAIPRANTLITQELRAVK